MNRALASIIPRSTAVVIALAFGAVLALLQGWNPLNIYYDIMVSAFTPSSALLLTSVILSILILNGLSALVSFKAGIWNIGQEGFLYMGAVGATGAILFTNLGLPGALFTAAILGSVWSLLAGILKVRFSMDEIVTTILFNFIAILLTGYLVEGPWKSKTITGAPMTDLIPVNLRLSGIGLGLNTSLVLAIALVALLYITLKKSKLGFEIDLMGGNIDAAKYAGVNIQRRTLMVFALSGAVAGLGGAVLLTATSFSLSIGISSFYGWLGISVALLGGLDVLAVIPSALLFSILTTGSVGTLVTLGIPVTFSQSIAAVVIIVVLIHPLLRKRFERIA